MTRRADTDWVARAGLTLCVGSLLVAGWLVVHELPPGIGAPGDPPGCVPARTTGPAR